MSKVAKVIWPNSSSARFTLGVLVLFVALSCLAAFLWSPWLRDGATGSESNAVAESNIDTLRSVGLLIGGVLALVFGVWRAWVAERQVASAQGQLATAQGQLEAAQQQVAIAQQSSLNDTYQRSAEMLGSGVLAVRLGGIYALQYLADEYPEMYHFRVTQLLCAFVRHPTRTSNEYPDGDPIPRQDVQDAMTVLGSRSEQGREIEQTSDFVLDFRGAFLYNVDIHHLDFTRADFRNADLGRANLIGATLSGAKFHEARLTGATMTWAVCTGTFFVCAEMRRCGADRTDFSEAKLLSADLFQANLSRANFRGANLNSANLLNAVLEDADISGTRFGIDDLPADMDQAEIDQSYLHVSQQQLDDARADANNPPDLGSSPRVKWRGGRANG